jgi:hypothetical protein
VKGDIAMGLQDRTVVRALIFGLIAILLSSSVLAACGGDDNDASGEMTGDVVAPAMDDDADIASEGAPAPYRVGSVEQPDADQHSSQIAYDRLVIRTATITLTVEDTLDATASVRNLAMAKSGFVFSSTTYVEQERQYAQLTLRVPADRFDETISELRSAPWVNEVTREESSSQDVSAEFVDNESRLAALEETQRRYMALLEDAETIESILRLESELTSVRTQIESIKGRQGYLSEMTAFSTITVTLRPVDGIQEEEPDDEFSIARIFQSAWDRSSGALEGLAEVAIVLAIFAAFFAPLVALAYLAYRFGRRILGRQRAEAVTTPRAD